MRLTPDILAPLERYLTGPASPTADLYFGWPCAELISSGRVRQITPTVFQCEQTLIVVRHALGLRAAVDYNRLVYIMDDDWRAALSSKSLPPSYRAKLALVEARAARRLEPQSDLIVTSSDLLAERYRTLYPQKPIEVMMPAWPRPTIKVTQPKWALRVAFLGSWSHRHDFTLIEDALIHALDVYEDLEVVLSGNVRPSIALSQHNRLKIIAPLTWPEYVHWLQQQRFDICLYPLQNTSFNASRSINKLLEYGQTGAITMASEEWKLSGLPDEGLFIPVSNKRDAWTEALADAISNRSKRMEVYQRLHQTALQLDLQSLNSNIWSNILHLNY